MFRWLVVLKKEARDARRETRHESMRARSLPGQGRRPATHVVLLALLAVGRAAAEHCDHQHADYAPRFRPVAHVAARATPFFSPLHSLRVLTDLIENATETIDIMTPHWKSWISTRCDVEYGEGCTAEELRNQ